MNPIFEKILGMTNERLRGRVNEDEDIFRHIFPLGIEEGYYVKIDQLKYFATSFRCKCESAITSRIRQIFPQLRTLKHWQKVDRCAASFCCEHTQKAGHSFIRSEPCGGGGSHLNESFYTLDMSPEVDHFFKFVDEKGPFPPIVFHPFVERTHTWNIPFN